MRELISLTLYLKGVEKCKPLKIALRTIMEVKRKERKGLKKVHKLIGNKIT